MIDQKRENLLNLALAATEVERRRVPELSAGYNSYSKTWEVIVQYQGDLAFLEGQGVRVTLLLFSYAILLVPESLMDYVTGLPQITYLEKAETTLFFADAFARSVSCISPVQEGIIRVCMGTECCSRASIPAWTMHTRISVRQTGQAGLHFYGIRRFQEILRLGMLLGSVYTRRQINEALAASTPHGAVCPRAVPRCDGARDGGARDCRRKRAILGGCGPCGAWHRKQHSWS